MSFGGYSVGILGCLIANVSLGAMKKSFNSPAEFDSIVDMYMLLCDAEEKVPSHVGLALAAGLSCRQSLYDLQAKDEYTDSVKRARSLIEEYTVNRAMKTNGAGAIFLLKNMGYQDRQQVKLDPVNIRIQGTDVELG